MLLLLYLCKHRILSNHTKKVGNEQQLNDSNDNNDIEDLLKLLDNTHLDKLDSASSKVEEAKELLILECSKHIDMARAQRFLSKFGGSRCV